jgi:predicted O-linked N-acetylglucosamine transferase (SPINDLY family)
LSLIVIESDFDLEIEFCEINRLTDRGELEKALDITENLYSKYPEHYRVIHALGLLKYRSGDLDNGEMLIRKALQLKPDYVDAHYNLGRILHLSLRNDEAEKIFRAGIALEPNDPKQLLSLASILSHQNQYREAMDICLKLLDSNPSRPELHGLIGNIKLSLGESKEALEYLKKEMKVNPNNCTHSCILFVLNLISGITQEEIYRESVSWEKLHASWLYKRSRGHFNFPDPERRLRIGYVSGDFRNHPVGYHIRLLLSSYNKSEVEVYLYDTCPLKETTTKELAALADHYRSISQTSDDKAEAIIRRDGIDILVDLSGHTGMHRLTLFARRPAPVQATWIGYFNTTGMEAIDYFIGDIITNPPLEDHLFTETVVRLPDNRFCYQAQSYAPEVRSAPALKNGYVTFGSFNGLHKISRAVITLWSNVLTAVPASRFILKLVFADDGVKEQLYSHFESCGVSRERVEIRGKSPHAEMLGEYGDIDISLDTFPFNGGITTCESLWMGVPVVTLGGTTPIGRQSKAYLHTIGHPEWGAETLDEYIHIATDLASELMRLDVIRKNLRQEMMDSPLCDGKRFAANLENIYREMWKKWCANSVHHLEVSSTTTRRFKTDELFDAGVHCLNDGDYERAYQLFRRFIRRSPGHAPAYNNLAVVLKKMENLGGAVKAFRQAIRNDSFNIDIFKNLGLTLMEMRAYRQSRDVFRKACLIDPGNLSVWNELGTVYRYMGHLRDARLSYERSLTIDPDNVDALGLLAVIMGMYGDNPRSFELLKSALIQDPENQYLIAVLINLKMYQEGTNQEELYQLSKKFESTLNCSAQVIRHDYVLSKRTHLRIGFISPDFSAHPVGMLLTSFFREFDRSQLSLICFNRSKSAPDHLTDWYHEIASEWHNVDGMEDDTLIELVASAHIDILVDLSGHTNTNNNGISLFNRRAAPVQVAWLGYGNTTGLSQMDYIIADKEFIRPEDRQWFSEKPMYLSHNRFCFTPPIHSPEVTEPPCLDNKFITFGSFNNIVKVNDQVIGQWVRILRQVPKSRLILKYKSLNEYDVRKFTLERFRTYGISSKRIELRPSSNLYFMLTEYSDVDITLDPFPFTGGMTSLFSLWMGVPIISLAGELPISRQTKSFLDLVGLGDLVAKSYDEYVNKAVILANNMEQLKNIRETVRQRMLESPLCDAKKYSSELCELFFTMWNDKRMKLTNNQ